MPMLSLLLFPLFTLCSSASSFTTTTEAAASSTSFSADLQGLFDEYGEWKLSVFPEYASTAGFHQYDDRLHDLSLKALGETLNNCQLFQQRAESLLQQEPGQSALGRYYLLLLKREAEACVRGIPTKGYLFAEVSAREGIQFSLPQLFSKESNFRLDSIKDYETVLRRLHAVPDHINQTIDILMIGIQENMTYPEEAMAKVKEQFTRLQVPAENSEFYTLFRNLENRFGDVEEVVTLKRRAKNLIEKDVLPAFQLLDDFLQDQYMKHLRPGPGVSHLPNGTAFYQACLEFHTSLKGLTPEEVHKIGLEGVKELRKSIEEQAQKMGYANMSFVQFIKVVQDRADQAFASKEEALAFFRKTLEEKVNPRLTEVVGLPKRIKSSVLSLEVLPTPSGDTGVAYYIGPARDGRRNGSFYLNLEKTSTFKKFETTSLVLHEGNPGHNYQTVTLRKSNLPLFAQYSFYDRLSSIPSRVPIPTAYSEGWGLYAEYLGNEMGLFKDDPYQLVGFYSWGLLRSVRLVVDTGIHVFGWTKKAAVEYVLKNTAISRTSAELQVDRFITWPGQATAYRIGERHIRRVRASREKELGDAFDLKAFHRHVILCMGGLDQMEQCVKMRESLKENEDQEATGAGNSNHASGLAAVVATVMAGWLFR